MYMYDNITNSYNGITILSNSQTCECMPKWVEYAFIINLSISVILNVLMTVILL